jgi:hypothetical protein
VALSGDVSGTGLSTSTWVDLMIDGTYVQSEPIQAITSPLAPSGAAFIVERLPGRAAGQTAPTLAFLSGVRIGSTVLVRVSTTTHPLGVVGTIPLSPLAGQVIATGTFR